MRRSGALLGWIGLLLGLWLLLRGGGSGETAALDATRMLAYPLEDSLRFALEPGATDIKVVSWLVEPSGWPRDVRVTSPYCLRFTVRDDAGAVLRDWPVFVRARGGLVRTADGRLHAPNWLPDSEEPVSDDRLTRVQLDGIVPAGGSVELSRCWTPPGARVLATVYQEGETTLARRLRRLRGETDRWQRSSAARFSPFPWERTPGHWQKNLASRTWERLGALQEGAVRVPTVPVMTTFHKGSWLDESALGVPVPPGGVLAFNLEGPTELRGSWWTLAGGAAVNVPTELRVFRGGARTDTVSGDVHRVGPIAVGLGVVSVEVGLAPNAPGPLYFRAWTSAGDADRAWGDPPRQAPDDRALQPLAPDFRNLELYRALPEDAEHPPLVFPVQDGEWVRALAFARLPPALPGLLGPERPPAPGPSLRIACVDALGRTLAEHTLATTTTPSLFERYTQLDTPATAAPSEPETLVFLPPPGTVALRVVADAAVDVGLRVTREPELEPIVWRGYTLDEGFEADGRWVPLVRNPWRARAPEDVELLLRALRAPRIDAQVRLEEEADGLPRKRAPTPLRSLSLWEPFEVLAEPASDGALTRLSAAPAQLQIGAAGRLLVEYRVDPGQVGAVVHLRLGAREVARTLPAAAGTLRVDGLAPGPLQVSVDAPGLFLARAEGRPAWRTVRVQRLPSEPTRSIALPAGEGVIVLHPYAARGGGRLRWRRLGPTGRPLDAGVLPLRPRGGVALPLSFDGSGLLTLDSARVALGADNPGGALLVWVEGADAALRATASWAEEQAPDAVYRPMGPAR